MPNRYNPIKDFLTYHYRHFNARTLVEASAATPVQADRHGSHRDFASRSRSLDVHIPLAMLLAEGEHALGIVVDVPILPDRPADDTEPLFEGQIAGEVDESWGRSILQLFVYGGGRTPKGATESLWT